MGPLANVSLDAEGDGGRKEVEGVYGLCFSFSFVDLLFVAVFSNTLKKSLSRDNAVKSFATKIFCFRRYN